MTVGSEKHGCFCSFASRPWLLQSLSFFLHCLLTANTSPSFNTQGLSSPQDLLEKLSTPSFAFHYTLLQEQQ